MAGHSRWEQIKRGKAKTDSARSRIFSKFAKLISVEAKRSKGDKNDPGLRAMIERAKAENVPNENIERAIAKAETSADMERITYEAYGPGGVAIIVEALTDNKNRAVQNIKHILLEHKSALASQGSALWAFEKKNGVLQPTTTIPLSDEDLNALGALVDALESSEDVEEVITNAE